MLGAQKSGRTVENIDCRASLPAPDGKDRSHRYLILTDSTVLSGVEFQWSANMKYSSLQCHIYLANI